MNGKGRKAYNKPELKTDQRSKLREKRDQERKLLNLQLSEMIKGMKVQWVALSAMETYLSPKAGRRIGLNTKCGYL